ncbi:hypothetical protein AAG570_008720 [Ranatra chinensis]|uniref:Uncharacterized protein n=1 Tax=Ranatra chinensis TaxID=642074 RepID=A0ABD0Z8V0_9HEMI
MHVIDFVMYYVLFFGKGNRIIFEPPGGSDDGDTVHQSRRRLAGMPFGGPEKVANAKKRAWGVLTPFSNLDEAGTRSEVNTRRGVGRSCPTEAENFCRTHPELQWDCNCSTIKRPTGHQSIVSRSTATQPTIMKFIIVAVLALAAVGWCDPAGNRDKRGLVAYPGAYAAPILAGPAAYSAPYLSPYSAPYYSAYSAPLYSPYASPGRKRKIIRLEVSSLQKAFLCEAASLDVEQAFDRGLLCKLKIILPKVLDLETVEKRVRAQLQERRARLATAVGRAPAWRSWRNPGLSRRYGDRGTAAAKTALSG